MDSLNEVLVECVKACGGSKQVGPMIWPEKTPDAAQRLLLDCLNEDRPAHLTPDSVLLVLRLARVKGCHVGMNYLAERLGYAPPVPVSAKDRKAELQRDFVAAAEAMAAMLAEIKSLPADVEVPFPNLRAA